MKHQMATAIAISSVFSFTALAGEFDTPHEFESGTPALASEVNENFSEAETAINDNNARIESLETSVTALEEPQLANQKLVVLQEGLAGYSGTTDTTLTIDNDAWIALGIEGEPDTAESLGASIDDGLGEDTAIALLRFDVTGLTDNMLSSNETCSDNIVVMDALLVLRASLTADQFLGARVFDADAPLWSEESATWDQSTMGVDWPTGVFADTPVLNSIDLEYRELAGGRNSTLFFNLDTSYIKSWVCEGDTNKGLLFGQSSGIGTISSSENGRVSFRPKLKLILQKI